MTDSPAPAKSNEVASCLAPRPVAYAHLMLQVRVPGLRLLEEVTPQGRVACSQVSRVSVLFDPRSAAATHWEHSRMADLSTAAWSVQAMALRSGGLCAN